ncbi:MAG: DUF433 domain-containing protein [Phycicoccus sp.]
MWRHTGSFATTRSGGARCIRGTRSPVATVLAMVADGMTPSEILADYPQLAAEAAHAVAVPGQRRHAAMRTAIVRRRIGP